MSLPPYLTEAEVAEITAPLTQGAARIKFFKRLRVKVEAKPNGQPLIWRADFEAARIAKDPAANDSAAKAAHNWTEFDNRVRYGRGQKT